jgi:PleD family two-component response regulator
MRAMLRGVNGDRSFPITVSIGCQTFLKTPDSVEELLGHADRLMHEAKRSGKDKLVQAVT